MTLAVLITCAGVVGSMAYGWGVVDSKLNILISDVKSYRENVGVLSLQVRDIERRLERYDSAGTPTVGPEIAKLKEKVLEFDLRGSPALTPRVTRLETEMDSMRAVIDKVIVASTNRF